MARDFSKNIVVNEQTRRFKIHLPDSMKKGEKLPLIIVLHGAASYASLIEFVTRMSRKADREKFCVVYPNGTARTLGLIRTWNTGIARGPAYKRKIDDVKFIDRIIENMIIEHKVDEKRIYVAGMSNGGMMAYRIASELSDKVAAVGVVQAAMFGEMPDQGKPVNMIVFHGDKDKVFPLNGGRGKWFVYRFDTPSTMETINYWVKRNNCRDEPEIFMKNGVAKYTYGGGTDNTEVVFYKISNGGHFWPGGRRFPVFYRPSKKISATDEMCKFFFSHSK